MEVETTLIDLFGQKDLNMNYLMYIPTSQTIHICLHLNRPHKIKLNPPLGFNIIAKSQYTSHRL